MSKRGERTARALPFGHDTDLEFWAEKAAANVVQIGAQITERRRGESVGALVQRAIQTYPDKAATLVVVG